MASLAALGDADDPYGGMGRNGAQHTPEADGGALELRTVGQPLALVAGRVHNVNADACIGDHSDITRDPTAYLVLAAGGQALHS
jgi:hypothetical protein